MPSGRRFLTGKIKTLDDLVASDWRRSNPRIQIENFDHNLMLAARVREIAFAHKVTPAQLAFAWPLRQGGDIVPIPGTKHESFLEENARAVGLTHPESAWSALDGVLSSFCTA